jgi:hypothetical protein
VAIQPADTIFGGGLPVPAWSMAALGHGISRTGVEGYRLLASIILSMEEEHPTRLAVRGGPCRRVGCLLRSGYPGVLGDQPLSSSGQHGSEAVGTIPGACWWGKPNGQGSLLSAGDARGGQRWVGVGGGVGMVGREQVEYCPQCLLWRALICGGCRIARPRR